MGTMNNPENPTEEGLKNLRVALGAQYIKGQL